MKYGRSFMVLFLVLIIASSGCAQEKPTPELYGTKDAAPSQKIVEGTEVTVYNSNLGIVKQARELSLSDGFNRYLFEGVAANIDPTSVKLRSADGSFGVLEQNYQYDLVNKQKILQKYLGKKITGYTLYGDSKELVEGVLLSASGNELVIEKPDGSIQIVGVQDLHLPALPQGLIVKPTLEWLIVNSKAGSKMGELSYMTSGMSWDSDYVAVVNKDDDMMDLNGWVTITNNAGTTFENATLKLVAGDVNRVQTGAVYEMEDRMYAKEMAPASNQFSEQSLFEYHMYDLERKTTLKDQEKKQISLLTADGVSVEKEFVYESSGGWYTNTENNKIQVKLNFKNSEENSLGIPLPKGRMRVFKEDADGMLQFIGEDQIDHTPKDETLRILMGNAFDVVGERKRMNLKDLGCQYEVSWEVSLKNHKDENIKVTVIEKSYWDWTIVSENFDHVRESNERIKFSIPVKANGEEKLSYTIRYNNC